VRHALKPRLERHEHRLGEATEQAREHGDLGVIEDLGRVAQIAHAQPLDEVNDLLAQGSDGHRHHAAIVGVGAACDEPFGLGLTHQAAHGRTL